MGTLRNIKRDKDIQQKQFIEKAYKRGFKDGVAEQRKSDIQSLVKILEGLEEMPGIGIKTAEKVRYWVANKFGN